MPLPKTGTLATAVYQSIVKAKRVEAKAKKGRNYFRGSETTDCNRRLWYARMGTPIDTVDQPISEGKSQKGNLIHDWFRKTYLPAHLPGWRLENMEEEIELEVMVKGVKVRIILHKDGLLISPKGDRYIFELKTTSGFGYKACLKTKMQDPTHYSYSYRKQSNLYFWAEKQKYPKKRLDGVCLVLYNVNGDEDSDTGLEWKDFWFAFDPALLNKTLEQRATVQKSVKRNALPKRGFEVIGWECAGALPCPWLDTCWPPRQRVFADPGIAKKARGLVKA